MYKDPFAFQCENWYVFFACFGCGNDLCAEPAPMPYGGEGAGKTTSPIQAHFAAIHWLPGCPGPYGHLRPNALRPPRNSWRSQCANSDADNISHAEFGCNKDAVRVSYDFSPGFVRKQSGFRTKAVYMVPFPLTTAQNYNQGVTGYLIRMVSV